MATVIRKRTLVNPARRRKLSAKQIKFFGTARQRAALKARKKKSAAPRSHSHRSKPRTNVAAIVTAGLPAMLNPYRSAKRRKVKNTMAKTKKRRATAKKHSPTKARRRRSTKRTNPSSHRARTRTVVKYRYRTKARKHSHKRPRSNPSIAARGGILPQVLAGTAGAGGSRSIS